MSIEITERTVAMWFGQLGPGVDWLMHMEDAGSGEFRMTYRFRYYDPDAPSRDPFEDKDQKSWYVATGRGLTRKAALEKARELVKAIQALGAVKVDEVLNDGDVDAFMADLTSRPWCHARTERR